MPSTDYRALFEAAPDRYVALDLDLRIIAASRAYAAALGLADGQLQGRALFEVLPSPAECPQAEGQAQLYASLARMRQSQTAESMRSQACAIRNQNKLQRISWNWSNTPIFDDSGALYALLHRVENAGQAQSMYSSPVKAQQRLAGINILAAEDNRVNQLVLAEMLQSEGATVAMAENGRDALWRLEEKGLAAFDIVLLDIQMPQMDGYQAARLMRAIDPELPIIGQTALTGEQDRLLCLNSGMIDYIPKPLNHETLINMIRRHARTPAPNPSVANSGEIRWSELEARYARKPAFVAQLLTLFLQSNLGLDQQLQRALDQGERNTLIGLVHGLKGSAGSIMALDLVQHAQRVEHALRQPDNASQELSRELIRRLSLTLDQVRARLKL